MNEKYLSRKGNYNFYFYIFDNEAFEKYHEQILLLERNRQYSSIRSLSDEMLKVIENDYQFIKENKEYLSFYKLINEGNINRYIDLYYELTLSKLKSVSNGDFSLEVDDDKFENYMYLRDAFLRKNSARFFKRSWFIPQKYCISDGFALCFISEETHSEIFDIYNGMIKYDIAKYYLNAELSIGLAEKLTSNFSESGFNENDIKITDKLFIESIREIANHKTKILYPLGHE